MTHRTILCNYKVSLFLSSCVIRTDGGVTIFMHLGWFWEILLVFTAAPELNVGILHYHWLIAGVKEPECITVRRNLCLIS